MKSAKIRQLQKVRQLRAEARQRELAKARAELAEAETVLHSLMNEQRSVAHEIRLTLSSVSANQSTLSAQIIATMVRQIDMLKKYSAHLDEEINRARADRQSKHDAAVHALDEYRLSQRKVDQMRTLADRLAEEEVLLEEKLEEMNADNHLKRPNIANGKDL